MYKLLLLLVVGFIFSGCNAKPVNQGQPKPITIVQNNPISLPSEEDIIRTFFALINEKRIPEAIGMMSTKMAADDSIKQAWGVQFNDFDSVKVVSAEKSIEENLYKVTLEVRVNQRAADYPIPYYGYGDKSDVRFIKLIKDDRGLWKIDGIATGP